MATTILTVDDDRRFVDVLQNLLEENPEFQVVGEAENGQQAIGRVDDLRPDVVLLDLTMPLLNGFDTLREIKHRWPNIKIIILTVHSDYQYQMAAFENGADGFLPKKDLGTALVPMIGQVVFSPTKGQIRSERNNQEAHYHDIYSSRRR